VGRYRFGGGFFFQELIAQAKVVVEGLDYRPDSRENGQSALGGVLASFGLR